MEDTVAYFLIASLVVLFVWLPYSAYKLIKRSKQKAIEAEKQREEALRTLKVEREASWNCLKSGATHVGKTQYDYNMNKTRTTVTEKDTGKRVSYVHENDSGPDLLTTMIVADMLLNNKDSSSGRVKWDNDVPSVTTSSSDDDTRKSSSWSSSPSYNDSGPSYSDSSSSSSSSDSRPSSDW